MIIIIIIFLLLILLLNQYYNYFIMPMLIMLKHHLNFPQNYSNHIEISNCLIDLNNLTNLQIFLIRTKSAGFLKEITPLYYLHSLLHFTPFAIAQYYLTTHFYLQTTNLIKSTSLVVIVIIIHFTNFKIKYFFIIVVKICIINLFIMIIVIVAILRINFNLIDFKSNF